MVIFNAINILLTDSGEILKQMLLQKKSNRHWLLGENWDTTCLEAEKCVKGLGDAPRPIRNQSESQRRCC